MGKKDMVLTILILLSLVLGVLWGQFYLFDPDATPQALAEATKNYQLIGEYAFIRPLLMLVVPIVFVSVLVGVTSIGDPQKLGFLGVTTLAYYMFSMLAATALGLALVTWIGPGRGENLADYAPEAQAAYEIKAQDFAQNKSPDDVGGAVMNLIEQMLPKNPIAAAAEGNTLAMVIIAILLGVALVMCGEVARPAIRVFDGIFAAIMKLVMWVIWLAPIGVFFVVAARVGQVGLGRFAGPIGLYALTVVIGLIIHGAGTLPLILFIFRRINPYRFMWKMRKAIITGFSTASSSATLPITIEECVGPGGCSKRATNFVVPLGATVNMDGTALYQAVAVVFLFQMSPDHALTITQLLIILITAVLAAVGAAGIPSAGLITMTIIITAVNASLEAAGQEPLPMWTIMIIVGVDRILDMCRTTINVWGDAVGAKLLTPLAGDMEEQREKAFA